MIKKIALCTLFITAAQSGSFAEYKAKNTTDFHKARREYVTYHHSLQEQFQSYKKLQNEAFKNYIKELGRYWQKPVVTTKKVLVAYSKDKKSQTRIDFAKHKLSIQTYAKNQKEAKEKLQIALAQAVTFNTKDFYQHDALEQKLAHIPEPKNMKKGQIDAQPILAPVIFKEKPTKKSVFQFVNNSLNHQKITVRKSTKLHHEKIYSLTLQLPNDTTIKRSQIYYEDVKQASRNQKISIALIFAIMHTESSFNPMARSWVPAYGLMQIVPRTAGIDAYYYLYKEKRLLSGNYLYNSRNNIAMGSAYLHLLYYSYLKEIKNPTSRLYCTIAAYNTGAGNVARAFTGTTNRHRAAHIINALTPQEVYIRLIRDLRYNEAKRYLHKVSKRVQIYQKIYG